MVGGSVGPRVILRLVSGVFVAGNGNFAANYLGNVARGASMIESLARITWMEVVSRDASSDPGVRAIEIRVRD
jgi:hypothetical protein